MSKYYDASLVQIPSGYKAGTLYSVLPANGDGDFDFTRASIATRVNAEGLIETVASGVPRLDYPILNGVVQSCPALLLEPARTNLLTYSEDFSNAAWSKNNTTVSANQSVSPSGSTDADELFFTADSNTHSISQAISLTSGTTYSQTYFVKNNGQDYVQIYTAGPALSFSYYVNFDLTSGTIPTSSGMTGSVLDYGNGWFRISATATAGATNVGSLGLGGISTATSGYRPTYVGSGESVYVWGAQLEAGSYATSYIPTAGTTVARAAEVCNGAGTSAEFNDSEGVLFAEISALVNGGDTRTLSISDGTNSNTAYINVSPAANVITTQVIVGGVAQCNLSLSTMNQTNFNKVAVKYKADDFAFWVNGFEVATDAGGVTFSSGTLDRLNFDFGQGSFDFYGKTKQLIAFDAALTDEELEDLTSWDSFEEMAASQLYTIY